MLGYNVKLWGSTLWATD